MAAVVGYGMAAHFAMSTGRILPALTLMMLLLTSSAVTAFRRGAPKLGTAWLVGTAALVGLALTQQGIQAIYLPPIMINSLLFWGFARTLAPGQTPLITVFAKLIDGDLDEAASRYTRRATFWWSGFLAFLVVETVLLALWAPREVWSAFAHFINYGLLGIFFYLEYRLRRHCLPHYNAGGFLGFVKSLARVDVRATMRQIS